MELLYERYPALTVCREEIAAARDAMIRVYERGGKILLCGNGGSGSDCDHITGELMKGFRKRRPLSAEALRQMKAAFPDLDEAMAARLQQGLPAIPLTALTGFGSAVTNDIAGDLVYAQGVLGLGKPGDLLIGISTSGNAANVCAAAQIARSRGLDVIALTGEDGGRLAALADVAIRVPETETYRVQELHLPVYHALCAAVEDHFFAK